MIDSRFPSFPFKFLGLPRENRVLLLAGIKTKVKE